MPRQTEPSANNALGGLLQGMTRGCSVRSENVRAIVDRAGLQPDILITAAERAPVVVEAEFDPARNVEAEAKERLGLEVVEGRRKIEAAVALIYPESVADSDDLARRAVRRQPALLRLHHGGQRDGTLPRIRLAGRLGDRSRGPDPAGVRASGGRGQGGDRAAGRNRRRGRGSGRHGDAEARYHTRHRGPAGNVRRATDAQDGVRHHRQRDGVSPADFRECTTVSGICDRCAGTTSRTRRKRCWAPWTVILGINYWPIFAIAKDVLEQLPSGRGGADSADAQAHRPEG